MPVTIQNIADELVVTLGRPEKAAFILSAVKMMVVKAHSADNFRQDLTTVTSIAVDTPAQRATFDVPTRFRSFGMLYVSSSAGVPAYTDPYSFAIPVNSDQLFDTAEFSNRVKAAVIGTKVHVYSPYGQISHVTHTYYQYPDANNATTSTWITDNALFRQMILDGASYYVRHKLGQLDQARVELQYFERWRQELIALNLMI